MESIFSLRIGRRLRRGGSQSERAARRQGDPRGCGRSGRPVAGQSSHLERLHHRLREEQERRRQEQRGSSFSLHQEIESVRSCSPVLPLEAPPASPLGVLASGVAAGGDPDDGDGDDSSSHDTDFSANLEPEGWDDLTR